MHSDEEGIVVGGGGFDLTITSHYALTNHRFGDVIADDVTGILQHDSVGKSRLSGLLPIKDEVACFGK